MCSQAANTMFCFIELLHDKGYEMVEVSLLSLDTITVQAPHPPSAHPSFVPVRRTVLGQGHSFRLFHVQREVHACGALQRQSILQFSSSWMSTAIFFCFFTTICMWVN